MDPCTPRFARQWTTTGSSSCNDAFAPHGSWCTPDAWWIPVYTAQWITGTYTSKSMRFLQIYHVYVPWAGLVLQEESFTNSLKHVKGAFSTGHLSCVNNLKPCYIKDVLQMPSKRVVYTFLLQLVGELL